MGNEKQNRNDETLEVVFDVLSRIMCTPKNELRYRLN